MSWRRRSCRISTELLDRERLEVSDDDAGDDAGSNAAPTDALEAFCQKGRSDLAVPLLQGWKPGWPRTCYQAELFYNGISVLQIPTRSSSWNQQGGHAAIWEQAAEPLILRARAATASVTLTNHLPAVMGWPRSSETWSYNMVATGRSGVLVLIRYVRRVGRITPQLVDYNLLKSDRAHVGLNDDSHCRAGCQQDPPLVRRRHRDQ